jgi:hypothetical protein
MPACLLAVSSANSSSVDKALALVSGFRFRHPPSSFSLLRVRDLANKHFLYSPAVFFFVQVIFLNAF